MVEHGCSTFTPGDSGRVLDRLASLEQVISVEAVRQALLLLASRSLDAQYSIVAAVDNVQLTIMETDTVRVL